MEQIRLDLIPNGIMPNVHASQFDKSRTVRFNLYEGDTPFTLLATDNVKVTCNGVEDSTLATAGTSHEWTIPDAVVSDSGVFLGELSVERGSKIIGSKNFVLNVEEDAYNGANIEERTASGTIATFDTNLVETLTSCKCQINPVQDLHGYTKPWSGGAGKNKLDYLNNLRASSSGLTIEGTSSGAIHYSGTATQSYSQLTFPFNLSIPSGTTITVSRDVSLGYQHYFSFTFTDNSVDYVRIMPNTTSTTYTLAKDLKNIDIVCLGLTVGTAYNATVKFQLEYGSQATSWEPYTNICPITGFSGANIVVADENMVTQSTTVITFGQEVYGGVLDVTNGKLRVTHGIVDLSTLAFTYESANKRWIVTYPTMKTYVGRSDAIIFEKYETDINVTTGAEGKGCVSSNYILIYTLDSVNAPSGNAVIELATPTEITLTPKQIEALIGVNNVYHDCNGETEVKYLVEV